MACNSLIYGSLIIRTLPQEISGAHVFHFNACSLRMYKQREREREKNSLKNRTCTERQFLTSLECNPLVLGVLAAGAEIFILNRD